MFSHQLGKPRISQGDSNQVTIDVNVTSNQNALAGALVFLVVTNKETGAQHVHSAVANTVGEAQLTYSPVQETPKYISAVASSGTWYGASLRFSGTVIIECPPLVFDGPLGWWHQSVGITRYDPNLGQGIKVGLIDTGVGPHSYLAHVIDRGAVIEGEHISDGADVSYHGTMMAGLIAARPTDGRHLAGIAPGVSLSSVRVYKGGAHGAKADDVAQAIRYLSTDIGVDLINLSLSSDTPSEAQAAAVAEARMVGTYCIAAAGNSGREPIGYPAAFDSVAAISALGRNVAGPTSETNSIFSPSTDDKKAKNGAYLSSIGSYGNGLTALAPGTAIASTVPSIDGIPSYASQVGSSDAAAIVTGVLAAHLSGDAKYQMLGRGAARANYAEQSLNNLCQTLGLSLQYQGLGEPRRQT